MKKPSVRILLALVLFAPLSAAQDWEKIRFRSIPLGDGLHMLASGAGGNMAVLAGEDGVLIVDSDFRELAEKTRAAVAAISGKPVRYVVNTHWHFDHVGGNEGFAKDGSLIIAQENVRKRMASDQHIEIIEEDVPASPKEALPSMTFTKDFTIRLAGEEVRVLHLPRAHTDGDSIVHFQKANVIHAGDVFFNCGYPFIDVSGGGGIDGLIAAVEAILRLCDEETRIIPGHGPLAGRKDLETYRDLLKEFRDIVAREAALGKELETLLAERPTAELDRKWGSRIFPPEQFLEMVFRTLKVRDR